MMMFSNDSTPSRVVAHLDLDTFFVSVERLRDRRLAGKPILIGGHSDRAVVASCSYETRRFGVHSAMPMHLARRLCPEALVIKGDYEAYAQQSRLVTQLIAETAPLFQKASVDEFYVDLSGMDRFIGAARFADDLRQKVMEESGLPLSMGVSTNKTVSKVATGEAKPNGQLAVWGGHEKAFLHPLPVDKLPLVGEVTTQKLRHLGIDRVGTLAAMPVRLLQAAFGKAGVTLWERANGLDDTPVLPESDAKSLSKEITFERDTTDVHQLRQVLLHQTEDLAHDLRRAGYSTGCVTVKVRYTNFETHSRQVTLPATTADHLLIAEVLRLFEALYARRLLIRLVGVRFSRLVRGTEQLSLFDASSRLAPLYPALDHLRLRHGPHAVYRAATWAFHPHIPRPQRLRHARNL